MENFSLFVKVHLAEIIMIVVGLVGSIVIFYLLKNKPEKLGFKTKPKPVMYLLALLPLVVFAAIVFRHNAEGMSYPAGISVHRNVIIVDGVIETVRENTTDETTYVEESAKAFVYDKATGKEIANFPGLTPLYCAGDFMLGSGSFGYHIVDLNSGEVAEVMSEDDIKTRAGAISGEKIYSIELKEGETQFSIRTMRDKKMVFDPVLEKVVSPETHTPFSTRTHNEKFTSKKVDLFLGEELGKTKDGTILVLSYDDLEKKSFLISAISSGGDLLWTKRDVEISPKLEGQQFTIEGTKGNTTMDDQYFYFVNRAYMVCASLSNGELKWIVEI